MEMASLSGPASFSTAQACYSENGTGRRTAVALCIAPVAASRGCSSLSCEHACITSRFISLVSCAPRRRAVRRTAILALDPDFYKIPYVEGVPVGAKLKLFNLPLDQDRERLRMELVEWFQSIDITVVSLEFTDDPDLNAAGVGGFVEMSTKMEACMAVARLDGSKFKGRYVRMDFVERRPHERDIHSRKSRPSANPASTPQNRMFVGNLAWSMDDHGLHQLFSPHGTVYEARIMRDRESGRSRGFGFVEMSTSEEVQVAIAALDGQQVEGRSLKVNVAGAR